MKKLLFVVMFFLCANSTYASYAVVNSKNGSLLIGQQPHEPLPVASLTKIWSAYIVIKNSSLQEQVVISKEAAHMEGSSIYLQEGQTKTVEHLLYGLLLRSGNDAATALAEHVGGSVEGFVKLMNEEAIKIGLKNTTFRNPSGLHHDEHLISAYDMAYMLNIAMKHPSFRQIASSVFFSDGQVSFANKHRLIGNGNAFAGKTGYTKVAGRTLATYYKMKDREFSVVTLNTANDWQLHEELANVIEQQFSITEAVPKGKYRLAGKTISVEKPIEILGRDGIELQHIVRFSRLHEDEALWHVIQDGNTLAIQRVKIR